MSMLNKFGKALIHALMRNRKLTDTDSVMNLHDGYYNRLLLPGFVCTDGKPAKLFLWPGSDKDLIISFNGGGCALKPDDCKYPMEFKAFVLNHQRLYTANADEIYEFGFYFIEDNGIHSPMEANPFASWSKVMIPYVSADFHTGTADYPYIDRQGNERILHFNGYKNFLEIMKQIKKRWPAPKRIVITGSSAGSFGASALAGKIVEMYPECDNITVYCDSSYIPMPNWKEIAAAFWKCPEEIAATVHTNDICGDWLEALGSKYGHRIKLLYGCSTEDGILAQYSNYENTGDFAATEEWRGKMKRGFQNRVQRLHKAGINISYYINAIPDKQTGGTKHCISQDKAWHEARVDGISPAQWVLDAVNGKCYDVGMNLLE